MRQTTQYERVTLEESHPTHPQAGDVSYRLLHFADGCQDIFHEASSATWVRGGADESHAIVLGQWVRIAEGFGTLTLDEILSHPV